MRTVAKFQLSAQGDDGVVASQVAGALDRWASRKFRLDADGRTLIRKSGKEATYERAKDQVGEFARERVLVREPIDGGFLQTEVIVLRGGERTRFRCALGVVSDGGISPPEVQISSPRFIKDILSLPVAWTIGPNGERVFAQSFRVDEENVQDLEDLMESSLRRLPIVLVSELEGETLAGDLHEKLGDQLCALAHVVRLTSGAAWELTQRRGKEWSCYNGGVRLFWPFRSNTTDFRSHPLWTRDQQIGRSADEKSARDSFSRKVVRKIIEASTFIVDDSSFALFEESKLRDLFDKSRDAAQASGDYQTIAEAYARENDALRGRVDDLVRENSNLLDNIETLSSALRSVPTPRLQQDDDVPPATVIDAVAIARRELSETLLIAAETDDELLALNDVAGPPEKVLRYLRALSEMSEVLLERGALGRSVPMWLRERNVDCSVESETAKGNKDSIRFRTRQINGVETECDYHAKPSDGVSPDMCVRIYFAIAEEAPRVRVGYIGRHAG